MRYLLRGFDVDRFYALDDLVRLCYRDKWGRYNYPWRTPRLLVDTEEGLTPGDLEYINSSEYSKDDPANQLNGVCFHEAGGESFKVWINPAMKPGDLLYELVLLHELCHGYLGPDILHGKEWRLYFGRVLSLYAILVNPTFYDVEWQVGWTLRRYLRESEPGIDTERFAKVFEQEKNWVTGAVTKYGPRIIQEYERLTEMRKGCHGFTSHTTPTPAYLAYQLKRVGTGSRLT